MGAFLTYFKIRGRQTWRFLGDIGVIRVLFLFFVILPFVFFYLYNGLRSSSSFIYLLGVLGIVFMIQFKRRDWSFLINILHFPKSLFFVEYLILTLVVTILTFITGNYIYLIGFFSLLLCITYVKPNVNQKIQANNFVVKFIPNKLYEFKCGLRANLKATTVLYVLALGLSYNLYSAIITFILFFMTVIYFYFSPESRQMIEAEELSSKLFLVKKIFRNYVNIVVFVTPILLINYIFNGDPFVFLAYPVLFNTMCFLQSVKYALYFPNRTYNVIEVFILLGCLVSFVPQVSLILIPVNIFLFTRAIKNLNNYLYDYN